MLFVVCCVFLIAKYHVQWKLNPTTDRRGYFGIYNGCDYKYELEDGENGRKNDHHASSMSKMDGRMVNVEGRLNSYTSTRQATFCFSQQVDIPKLLLLILYHEPSIKRSTQHQSISFLMSKIPIDHSIPTPSRSSTKPNPILSSTTTPKSTRPNTKKPTNPSSTGGEWWLLRGIWW